MAPFNSSSAQQIDNAIETLGGLAGLVIAACLLTGLRAWLLSLCVGLVAPAITLPFW